MLRDPAFKRAYAVIMAGGCGTRFWPLSRRNHPKQLLALFEQSTLLEQTVNRIRPVIPPERTYVFTNKVIQKKVRQLLPGLPPDNIVAEPASRNTAPTLGVAAWEIYRRDPEGIMVVLPADQTIGKPAVFRQVLGSACRVASVGERSVVIGLKPTRPETGFGYVRLGKREKVVAGHGVFRVKSFTEKPSLAKARRYLSSGQHLWNGGIFVWKASTLIRNFERFRPEMATLLERIAEGGGTRSRAFGQLFPKFERISIDYALMEKISDIYAVPANIGWNDVGSWTVAYELSKHDTEKNARPGNSLSFDSQGNLVVSPKKFVATLGVHNLVIVETDHALLVCDRARSQDVGKLVEKLGQLGRDDLL